MNNHPSIVSPFQWKWIVGCMGSYSSSNNFGQCPTLQACAQFAQWCLLQRNWDCDTLHINADILVGKVELDASSSAHVLWSNKGVSVNYGFGTMDLCMHACMYVCMYVQAGNGADCNTTHASYLHRITGGGGTNCSSFSGVITDRGK
jgi:hypothetical protein